MTSAVLVNLNCNVRSLSERVLLNVTFDFMTSRYCIFYLSTDALAEQCVTYSTCSESKHKITAVTAVSAVTASVFSSHHDRCGCCCSPRAEGSWGRRRSTSCIRRSGHTRLQKGKGIDSLIDRFANSYLKQCNQYQHNLTYYF